MLQARPGLFRLLTPSPPRAAFHPMDERDEIKRLLAAAGEPPALGTDITRAVWARLERDRRRAVADSRWAWLPRGWEIACVVVAAMVLGVITAEWRLRRDDATVSADQHRYIASIDPTIPLRGKARP
jgi:hypothetical protein